MNLFEKLNKWISKLKGNQQKTLPAGTQPDYSPATITNNIQERKDTFVHSISTFEKNLVHSPNTIEYAIDQYMKSLFFNYTLNNKIDSYRATTILGSLNSNNPNGCINKEWQTALINTLKNNPNYSLQFQPAASTEPTFYHIRTSGYSPDEKSQLRLYLNIQRENISKFSNSFIHEMGDNPFYFKMVSDKHISLCPRSEAIVIYTDKKGLPTIYNKLNKIKMQQPELLKDLKDGNPFLKKIDGFIPIAPEPKTDLYHTRDGKTQKISKSFNTFLATALQESFVASAKEIISKDKELTLKSNAIFDNDVAKYVSLYPEIIKNHHEDLVGSVKYFLIDCAKRNPSLIIKGISKSSDELSR